MKRSNFSYTVLLVCIILMPALFSNPLMAQENPGVLLEKIYTQTDRPFYFPGETIWFKSYVVSAEHTISTLNDVMYADLISPKGSTVRTIKLAIHQGYAYGDFSIDANWVGGIYTIRTYTNWMRNYGEEAFFTKKITIQKVVKPNLLLSLDFEKESYGQQSSVLADFTAKDLKNNPVRDAEITYEVFLKGQIIQSLKAKTNAQGEAKLKFKLPQDLNSRDVTLNVILPNEGSRESISRSVPIVLDNVDFQFFPESGKLLSGTQNRVAFKVIDEFGKPVDVEGDIISSSGRIVQSFESFHDGMGSFELNPSDREQYYAVLRAPFASDRKIPLPNTQQNGVNFKLTTDSLSTQLHIYSSVKQTLILEVANANKLLMRKTIARNEKFIELDTRSFPIGITTFRISDKNQLPLAERLAFINAHRQLKIDIQLDKSVYQTREKVKLSISTKDKNDQPIPANLSIAVADNKLLSYADDKQDHILSYLLLSSELKGKIHKPDFYFNPEEKKSLAALDYIMLTNGWRDYIITLNNLEEASFKPEQLAIEYGQITDLDGKPVQANLLLFEQGGDKVLAFESNKNGEFSFKIDHRQSLVLVAYAEDGQTLKINQRRIKNGYSNTSSPKSKVSPDFQGKVTPFKSNNPTQKVIQKQATASQALSASAEQLDEVVVTGLGQQKGNDLSASVVAIEAENFNNINSLDQVLQGRVAGVQVERANSTFGNAASIKIRGSSSISGINQALIVVDGVPYDYETLSNLNPNEVSSITVLKNAAATTLYGSAASNGVLMISTKNQAFRNSNWGKKHFKQKKYKNYTAKRFYNYQYNRLNVAKKFYAPQYDSKALPKTRTDFRQTIYWNPVVQTDENGQAELDFYNSDAITSFQITAEGIGYNGLIGRKKKTFATKKLLNIDVKLPNYMVLNDTIILPVTIRNETNEKINARLDILLPEQLQLLSAIDQEISIEANSFIIQNIKVIPIEKTAQFTIGLAVQAQDLKDFVKKESSIMSPYFPTEISISGSQSKSFEFSIENAVDGSIEADFHIYTDIIGDVMDGIAGIIRKPYGCFEQTSSSTYPNILVLKYLRESNRIDPKTEAIAMDYIKSGYQRLISFETKQGGFEWFGKTPPHETLTAFGVLEFTEMKEVYKGVNQKMINRTVKWLMSRKDGEGGFHKSKKGYDSFASSPQDVANAYIVYALSEAGIKVDIEKEYQHAFKDALKSNDTYKMALMACTSFNLDRPNNAFQLLEKIKQNIHEYQFSKLPVKNTITRSYGEAKIIETIAFSILALLKEESPNEALIAEGVEVLVGMRKFNRFGSTQSTCMALKALIEYTKHEKGKIIKQEDAILLSLNGKQFSSNLNMAKDGKIVIPDLASYLKEGTQAITIEYSNALSNFPYSFNIEYDSYIPTSSKASPLELNTSIGNQEIKVGDNVSMNIDVRNKKNENLGMVTSTIGLPSGTSAQSWQLKKLLDEEAFAYYEIFDNYLVLYWRSFQPKETKSIRLDLKADLAGSYRAPASTAYLYYGDEFKTWIAGTEVAIEK